MIVILFFLDVIKTHHFDIIRLYCITDYDHKTHAKDYKFKPIVT